MPSYNRYPNSCLVVEEAIFSFLQQDYGNSELILCNDTPGQEIKFDHPRVKVLNLPDRCRSLGEKLNVTASVAQGDLLMRWDDDDVYMPWRISYTVQNRENAQYAKGSHIIMLTRKDARYTPGIFGSCCFTRSGFDRIGGFPHCGVGEDQAIEALFAGLAPNRIFSVPMDRVYYFYRWDGSSSHVSMHGAQGYQRMGELNVEKGAWTPLPKWSRSYGVLANRVLHGNGYFAW